MNYMNVADNSKFLSKNVPIVKRGIEDRMGKFFYNIDTLLSKICTANLEYGTFLWHYLKVIFNPIL